ncbi:MAG: tetratricopeptide repeat protein [bacterium]
MDLGILFLLALALRLAYVADNRASVTFSSPLVDAWTYDQEARAVAAHGLGAIEVPFYQPPVYPLLLAAVYAATGGSYLAPRLLQALLGALTVLLVAWIAGRAAGRRAGWIAGGLLAAYGPVIYFEGELLPPALLLALLAGALALLPLAHDAPRRTSRIAAAGVLLGVATAARPTTLLFAAGAAGWLVRIARSRREGLREAALLAAAVALPVLPFTITNYLRGNEPILVSWNGGLNFYLGNGAGSDSLTAIQPGYAWDKLQVEPFRAGVRASRRAESAYWTHRALREAAADPLAWAESLGRKALRFVGTRETPRNTDYQDFRRDSWVLSCPLVGFGVVLPLALLGLLLGFAPPGPAAPALRALLAIDVAAVAAENLLFFVADRYRLEAVPALCVLAGLGVEAALRRRGRIGLVPGAVLVAGAALTHVDFLHEWRIDETRAAIHRAVALQHAGLEESSAQALRTALRWGPNDVDAHRLLGDHFERARNLPAAIAEFDRALDRAPDYLEALLAKAACLERLGRAAEAEPLFAKALQADPYSGRVRLLYGVHLAMQKRYPEARKQFETGAVLDPGNQDLRANLANVDRLIRGS